MSKKNTKSAKNEVHNIPISRSYDPYSMEQRIYNLEKNAGSTPTPAQSNIKTYTKNVTTNAQGWWRIEDVDGNNLDPTKHMLLSAIFENEGETGNTGHLICGVMIDQSNGYYLRFITMLDNTSPISSAGTHKVNIAYLELPEA